MAAAKAWAAYNEEDDWLPLGSVSADPRTVENWINKTYVSGAAREKYRVVKVNIKIQP